MATFANLLRVATNLHGGGVFNHSSENASAAAPLQNKYPCGKNETAGATKPMGSENSSLLSSSLDSTRMRSIDATTATRKQHCILNSNDSMIALSTPTTPPSRTVLSPMSILDSHTVRRRNDDWFQGDAVSSSSSPGAPAGTPIPCAKEAKPITSTNATTTTPMNRIPSSKAVKMFHSGSSIDATTTPTHCMLNNSNIMFSPLTMPSRMVLSPVSLTGHTVSRRNESFQKEAVSPPSSSGALATPIPCTEDANTISSTNPTSTPVNRTSSSKEVKMIHKVRFIDAKTTPTRCIISNNNNSSNIALLPLTMPSRMVLSPISLNGHTVSRRNDDWFQEDAVSSQALSSPTSSSARTGTPVITSRSIHAIDATSTPMNFTLSNSSIVLPSPKSLSQMLISPFSLNSSFSLFAHENQDLLTFDDDYDANTKTIFTNAKTPMNCTPANSSIALSPTLQSPILLSPEFINDCYSLFVNANLEDFAFDDDAPLPQLLLSTNCSDDKTATTPTKDVKSATFSMTKCENQSFVENCASPLPLEFSQMITEEYIDGLFNESLISTPDTVPAVSQGDTIAKVSLWGGREFNLLPTESVNPIGTPDNARR